MVAQTDIKYYVHTNHKAPQLENAYGSMLNVLDACLVNGFGSQTVESLTADGTTVTADFGKAHNLLRFQVIKIDGAIQDEFNGEHRILDVTANTITFEIATPATVQRASGLINCSLPPLGWEKPFASVNPTGGGKGAYRSKNTLLPNRPFLRVVDELDPSYNADWAKYAKVGMVEDMLDIDTMLGQQVPFDVNKPQKNWVGTSSGNGWAKWYYATMYVETSVYDESRVAVNGNRNWVIIGCQDWFYILNRTHIDNAELHKNCFIPNFFGFIHDDWQQSTAITASMTLNRYKYIYSETITFGSHSGGDFIFLNKSIDKPYEAVRMVTALTHLITHRTELLGTPSSNNPVVKSNMPLFEKIKHIPRGTFPMVEKVYQDTAYPHLHTMFEKGKMRLAVGCIRYDRGSLLLFDLGE